VAPLHPQRLRVSTITCAASTGQQLLALERLRSRASAREHRAAAVRLALPHGSASLTAAMSTASASGSNRSTTLPFAPDEQRCSSWIAAA
jgi:hypothetical protein